MRFRLTDGTNEAPSFGEFLLGYAADLNARDACDSRNVGLLFYWHRPSEVWRRRNDTAVGAQRDSVDAAANIDRRRVLARSP